MNSYKITIGQKNSITKPVKFNGMEFNPRQDINGDWYIWDVEASYCSGNFGWALIPSIFVGTVLEHLTFTELN